MRFGADLPFAKLILSSLNDLMINMIKLYMRDRLKTSAFFFSHTTAKFKHEYKLQMSWKNMNLSMLKLLMG